MNRRRAVIDFDSDREAVLARILQSEGRKARWKGNSDATITEAFNQGYAHVERSSDDGELKRQVISRDELPEMGRRWEVRAQRKWADSWAKNVRAIDPLTAWIIYQVISILIQIWWERRKEKLGS